MPNLQNEKTTWQGGFSNDLGGEAKSQNKLFECSADHISKVIRELQDNGVGLQGTSGATQIVTLRRALEFRGARGLNTYEGTAAGYARLATRIFDLEDAGWLINSFRENLIGPDGLYHGGIARYVLIGKRAEVQCPQSSLELGGDL